MPEKVNQKEIEKIAQLARIDLTKQEKEKFTEEIDSILSYFNDIKKVSETAVRNFDHYELKANQLREDKKSELETEENELIKKNFPEKKDGYLKVKAILKE